MVIKMVAIVDITGAEGSKKESLIQASLRILKNISHGIISNSRTLFSSQFSCAFSLHNCTYNPISIKS